MAGLDRHASIAQYGEYTHLLDLGAGEAERSEVPQDEVVVRALGLELVVALEQLRGDRLGVLDNLSRVLAEGGGGSLLERNSDTGDGLHQRSARISRWPGTMRKEGLKHTLLWGPPWQAGKTASLMRFSMSDSLSLRKKMRPARGPRRVLWLQNAQTVCQQCGHTRKARRAGLRGGGDDVAQLEGVVRDLRGDKAGDVGHVHPARSLKSAYTQTAYRLLVQIASKGVPAHMRYEPLMSAILRRRAKSQSRG